MRGTHLQKQTPTNSSIAAAADPGNMQNNPSKMAFAMMRDRTYDSIAKSGKLNHCGAATMIGDDKKNRSQR